MTESLKISLKLMVIMTLITGAIYPGVVTFFCQMLFPYAANGSLIEKDGNIVGSVLIGQNFTDPKYFWGRGSATSPMPYNAVASSGSNLSSTNPQLLKNVQQRMEALRQADPENITLIPIDLVTSSGSGLDPHISLAGAYYQASRVAKARGMSLDRVKELVDSQLEGRLKKRVNVLLLNLELDKLNG